MNTKEGAIAIGWLIGMILAEAIGVFPFGLLLAIVWSIACLGLWVFVSPTFSSGSHLPTQEDLQMRNITTMQLLELQRINEKKNV